MEEDPIQRNSYQTKSGEILHCWVTCLLFVLKEDERFAIRQGIVIVEEEHPKAIW